MKSAFVWRVCTAVVGIVRCVATAQKIEVFRFRHGDVYICHSGHSKYIPFFFVVQ